MQRPFSIGYCNSNQLMNTPQVKEKTHIKVKNRYIMVNECNKDVKILLILFFPLIINER